MKKIRWGIIGCGNVCEVKSGPAFQKAEHSALTAVMRRNGPLAEDYARRHGVPKWYDDADRLIADPEVDAVYVATPPGSHAEYAIKAARARKPVYVEKPMARDHGECLAIIEACRAAGTPLFVAYYRRRLPRFLKVKELLDQGVIGKVRTVSVTLNQPAIPGGSEEAGTLPWRVLPEISGGGLFLDLASHTLDLLDFLLGPIREAKGLAVNQAGLYRAEDAVTASLAFESGVVASGSWCFSSFTREDRVEILGSRGKILFSTFSDEPVTLITSSDANPGTPAVQEFRIAHPSHIQQPLIQSIVLELNDSDRCLSTGESAARATWVMDEILKDYRAKN